MSKECKNKLNKEPKKSTGRLRKWSPEWIDGTVARRLEQWVQKAIKEEQVVWIKDFALENGIPSSTFSRWNCDRYPNFAESYARAKDYQESYFVKTGLDNRKNAQFVMFCLKNNHGWIDRQDVATTDYKGLTPPTSDAMQTSESKRAAFKLKTG
jgi:hypothetical protein